MRFPPVEMLVHSSGRAAYSADRLQLSLGVSQPMEFDGADVMLCVHCGEREAEEVILIEAGPLNSAGGTSPEERLQRAEELSQLCERCLVEVRFPQEARSHVEDFLSEQRHMRAAATAEPAPESLRPLLDAVEREALHDPTDIAIYASS